MFSTDPFFVAFYSTGILKVCGLQTCRNLWAPFRGPAKTKLSSSSQDVICLLSSVAICAESWVKPLVLQRRSRQWHQIIDFINSQSLTHFALYQCVMVPSRKSTCLIVWIVNWISSFFPWNTIFTEKNDKTVIGYSDLGVWWTFSQNGMKPPYHFKENWWLFVASDKIWDFWRNS